MFFVFGLVDMYTRIVELYVMELQKKIVLVFVMVQLKKIVLVYVVVQHLKMCVVIACNLVVVVILRAVVI